jgi:protein-S-isoprenylcysteine O-methyltransferase Ste14
MPEVPAQGGSRGLFVALDIIERSAVALLFGFFVYRMIDAFVTTGALVNLVLVVSESLVVVFVLIRRSARIVSLNPMDWILAFVATAAPLCAEPETIAPLVPAAFCVTLTFAGLLLQIAAKLSLRRNFGIIAANRGITTGGPYNFVRHPMYLAYLLTGVGFLLANPTGRNLGVYAIAFSFQVARILAEERLLGEDAAYRVFASRVRYRVVPMIF